MLSEKKKRDIRDDARRQYFALGGEADGLAEMNAAIDRAIAEMEAAGATDDDVQGLSMHKMEGLSDLLGNPAAEDTVDETMDMIEIMGKATAGLPTPDQVVESNLFYEGVGKLIALQAKAVRQRKGMDDGLGPIEAYIDNPILRNALLISAAGIRAMTDRMDACLAAGTADEAVCAEILSEAKPVHTLLLRLARVVEKNHNSFEDGITSLSSEIASDTGDSDFWKLMRMAPTHDGKMQA